MTTIIPVRKSGEILSAAQAVSAWGVPGEERIYDQPEVYSWLTADVPVDGSGNYMDRSPRGNNGLQANVANQPGIYANPTTGHKAWTFDGTGGQYIPFNFLFLQGNVMAMAVVDWDASVGTGDNVTHAIVGSMLDSTANRYLLAGTNRKPAFFNISGQSTPVATALTVSVPHLVTYILDLKANQIGQAVDGGALQMTTGGSATFGQRDITGMIGAYRSNFGGGWKGHIYEVLLLTADVTNTALMTLFSATLKAKHQIP